MMRRYHQRLLYVGMFFFAISLLNAVQYFFAGAAAYRKEEGLVTDLEISSYFGRTRSTRRTYYTRTSFRLDGTATSWYSTESSSRDSLLLQLKNGDRIEIYGKRWYHYISYFGLESNLFLVRKNDRLIYDVRDRGKEMNKLFMIITAVMGGLLMVIWLDVVKNISLANWFQRKVLLNPEYVKRHRNSSRQ